MIITDKFIFINYPKTGSTFVRKTIKEIHNKNATSKFWNLLSKKETFYRIYKAPNLRAFNVPDRKDSFNEHGLRNQIPDKYKHLKIYSIKRSIFEILVSIYEYRDWEKTLPFSYKNIKEDYPNYPEISFKEFIEISYKKSFYAGHPKIGENALKIGFVSINLILFFCKEPFKILMNWDHHSISKIKEEINEVVFLKNEVLNNDL
ncbi:MAG: hypothetical protein ACPG5P_00515, partial [Saprospiraceae bacterium]